MKINASTIVEELKHRHVWLPILVFSAFLILVSRQNFLLFHTIAELFAVVIAILIYVVAWQSHPFSSNNFLMALACGYFWIGCLDAVHTLTYEGLNILPGTGANTATQFWVATRYFEAMLLLMAPFFIVRPANRRILFTAFGAVAAGIYAAVTAGIFPDAFVEGSGLTPFKIYSEYLIIGILGAALAHLMRHRAMISDRTLVLLATSIVLTMGAELAFTYYVSVYGLSNLVGHILKIVSYWLLFLAVARDTMIQPYKDLQNEIAEHAQATAAQVASEARLLGAVESLQEGFALFDADDRLVLANDAYRRFNSFAREGLEKGMRFEDLVRANVQAGVIIEALGREEEFIRERVAQHRNPESPIIRRRSDGRDYVLNETRTPEGGIALTFTEITDLKHAESALRESEERFRAVVDTSPNAVSLKDKKGRYLIVNKTWASWMNLAPEDMVGKTIFDLRSMAEAQEIVDHVSEVFASGKPSVTTRQRAYGDGRNRDVVIHRSPVRSVTGEIVAVSTITVDITDLKNSESALRESEERFRAVVDNAPAIIFLKDLEGRYLLTNKVFEDSYGVSEEKSLGKTPLDLFPKDLAHKFLSQDREVVAKQRVINAELEVLFSDGTWHLLNVIKFPIYDEAGNMVAFGGINTDITESRLAERNLLDARHRTERILQAAGEGIFGIDADGKTTFVNPAAARMLGWSVEELTGKNHHDMTHHTKAGGSPYPVAECPVEGVLKDGAAHHVSGEVFWRKDGGSFPVEYVSTPVHEDREIVGAVVVFRDITERQRAAAAVLESETLYRTLVEVSPDAIFVHVGNHIVFANRATAALLGAKNAPDLIGKPIMEIVHPDYRAAVQARIARLHAGEQIAFREFKFLRLDGGTVDVEVVGRLLKWKGVAAVQVIVRDVGERKRSQKELREITERDRQHVSQLERVLRTTTVAEMAAALAHQLNQPLSAVGNYSRASVRILESGKWTEDELKETLKKVIHQTDRAASIVRDIANFIGGSEGDAVFGDINGIMREAASLLKSEIDSHRINLVLDLSRDVVETRIVAIEIEQAILNLAMNSVDALKAKKRGKRELTMRTAIDVDGAIRISVLDTGTGVPPDVLANLFQPFMSTKPGGMGMGLSISRTIVEKHQGRIWAGKNGRGGAAFHFTLPVSPEASADGP